MQIEQKCQKIERKTIVDKCEKYLNAHLENISIDYHRIIIELLSIAQSIYQL